MSPDFNGSPETEIVSIRIVNEPLEKVFEAWSNAEYLKKWWGPKGFTNTFHEFDFKVGGKWIFTMHGPEKGNYPNDCEFTKIEKPTLIAWKRYSQPIFRVVTSFEDCKGKTKIIFRMVFNSAEERNKLIKFVPKKNEENFDKLEEVLSAMV
ncbi:MAG: hypothetical protein K0R26_2836 [Bacteroidota bacterium]|jgi:uncharacterized protein YndB with AHSA1/START domain|nr:hypothetical protein [Bacteroidota bacterium]